MPFGDAHVEHAVGHRFLHDAHRATRRHGRRHANDVLVLSGQLEQRLPEHVLIFGRHIAAILYDALARLGVELARRMPYRGTLLGRFVAFSFRGVQMKQLRPAHILELAQHAHHLFHVVPVERTEIANVHSLKDILLMAQRTLQRIIQAQDALLALLVQVAFAVEPPTGLEAQPIVGLVGIEVQQILLHAAHRTVNRHIVVVENNQQVVGRARHVVEPLEGQSAAHRTIADDRHDMPSAAIRRHSHAQGRRDRIAGVPAGERVVFAFGRTWKRTDAMQLPVRAEPVAPPRQYLVPVGLMPHVPHDTVLRRVENVMQGHRNLHRTQRRREVPRVHRHFVDNLPAQLLAHFGQPLEVEPPQVGRVFDLV